MKLTTKKIYVVGIAVMSLFLSGCSLAREVGNSAIETTLQSMVHTFEFMKLYNYSGEDITDVSYEESEDNRIIKFVLKNDISVFMSIKTNSYESEVKVIGSIDSNIDDLVNCSNYAFSYPKAEENYSVFKDSINQAINNPGEKINIPINHDKEHDFYVQALDGKIYIMMKI